MGGGLLVQSCLILATTWTVARQTPLSMEFSRQEHSSGLPFPSPGDLPHPGIKPRSPALQAHASPTELRGKLRVQDTEIKSFSNGWNVKTTPVGENLEGSHRTVWIQGSMRSKGAGMDSEKEQTYSVERKQGCDVHGT